MKKYLVCVIILLGTLIISCYQLTSMVNNAESKDKTEIFFQSQEAN